MSSRCAEFRASTPNEFCRQTLYSRMQDDCASLKLFALRVQLHHPGRHSTPNRVLAPLRFSEVFLNTTEEIRKRLPYFTDAQDHFGRLFRGVGELLRELSIM